MSATNIYTFNLTTYNSLQYKVDHNQVESICGNVFKECYNKNVTLPCFYRNRSKNKLLIFKIRKAEEENKRKIPLV